MSRRARLLPSLLFALVAAGCASGDLPESLREGRSIYGDMCSVCHGDAGQGGIGPPMESVVETWPQCADHVEWVTLGSEGWKAAHGDDYGATSKPVTGGMPGHETTLSPEQVRRVAAFERWQYGGEEQGAAIDDCGVSAE